MVAVTETCEHWRIRDDWWRKEIHRDYWRVVLEGAHLLTIYHDLMEPARWYLQNYTAATVNTQPLDVLAPLAAVKAETNEQAEEQAN